MPTIRLQKKLRLNEQSYHLIQYADDVTSQGGEDGVIGKIFEIMKPANSYCVEFGAWNGVHLSNTWALINMMGWGGLLIEGNEEKFLELVGTYVDNHQVQTLNRYVGSGNNSLDNILSEAGALQDFDLLSVDIDGNDWYIWESLKDFRPRLVIIEFNPSIPNDVYFLQDHDPEVNHGASLAALIDLGKQKGYELVAALNYNAFFVSKEDFPLFNIADNDIDDMHDCTNYETKIFQGYDGTLFLAGCDELLWKGIPIDQKDVQVLPKATMRRYFEPLDGEPGGYSPAWVPTRNANPDRLSSGDSLAGERCHMRVQ